MSSSDLEKHQNEEHPDPLQINSDNLPTTSEGPLQINSDDMLTSSGTKSEPEGMEPKSEIDVKIEPDAHQLEIKIEPDISVE